MEDDDEFGDLYSDVLPVPPQPQPQLQSPSRRPIDLNLQFPHDSPPPGTRVLDPKLVINPNHMAATPQSLDLMDTDVKFDIEEDDGPVPVPVPLHSNGSGAGDDWDSDSEDELHIVLNENPQRGPLGAFDDDDEDGDPLVIVADGAPSQPMEEAEWGEDAVQVGPDGERKEAAGPEGAKAGAPAAGASVPPKVGFSSHGYHPFSQYKYVRPGAGPVPGLGTTGSAGISAQVRPLINMSTTVGRGRGEWRPAGMKGGPGLQKYPGYGAPLWGSGRGYGGGLEFTLPSHKTIFEVDIDSFEEKPWNAGVDITDFFNFGLNEDIWKDYCKQLEQHRLETTMQSRIRVYESVRTEQEFDPDMPPELAAATGMHDASENPNLTRPEAGQADARVSSRMRPPLPTGRAIQVENGYGERLPSIDTRPPRIRDSDAIIEIVCQGSMDVDFSDGDVPDKVHMEFPSEEPRGDHVAKKENIHEDNEKYDSVVEHEDGLKKESSGRTPAITSAHDAVAAGDGSKPDFLEVPAEHPSDSKGLARKNGMPLEERAHSGACGISPHVSSAYSSEDRKSQDDREESVESVGRKRTVHKSSLYHREGTPVPGDRISDEGKGDAIFDDGTFTDNLGDGGLVRSRIKQKVSPRTENFEQDLDDGDDSRAGRSSENSKARSGSSREYQKWHDGVEEEVVQAGQSSRSGDSKRHPRSEQDYRRKGQESMPEMEKGRMVTKVREGSYRDWDRDQSMVHNVSMKTEGSDRRKERDLYDRAWQRRDDDPQNRRDRAQDTRKRDRPDEMGTRHRSRIRESDRIEKDDYSQLSLRKHIENGTYEASFDKDVGLRVRDRDDSSRSGRHESAGEYHSKRREDDYSRRDHANREEILHSHRESTSRPKRERDDDRRRDEQPRGRDDIEDRHSFRHKDDASSNRERSEKQRNREGSHRSRPAQDEDAKREREGQGSKKSVRVAEDKARAAQVKTRDDRKILDKDHHYKEPSRHVEHVKDREYAADVSSLHQRGREDAHSRVNQISNEEKRSRQERPTIRNDKKMRERGHKESTKKTKESEDGDSNSAIPSKKNQGDLTDHVNETGGGKGDNPEATMHIQPRKQREDDASDDEQPDSRRGRSKLERWMSHKERDFTTTSNKPSSSLKFKELGRNSNGRTPESSGLPLESSKHLDTSASTQQATLDERDKEGDVDARNNAENRSVDNRHLDTVEKLKKRSERFKLPMPSGKEANATKRIENEIQSSGKTDPPAELETKHERPARKRRWISS